MCTTVGMAEALSQPRNFYYNEYKMQNAFGVVLLITITNRTERYASTRAAAAGIQTISLFPRSAIELLFYCLVLNVKM